MPENTPTYEPDQEVRFAVVMYGGVSLAIYMYGVAEELWRLVRATAPNRAEHSGEAADGFAHPETESTEEVYRELGQVLSLDGPVSPDGRVRTRFVVDIVSGTSAGGINGICLAKALANDSELKPLEAVWVDDGDIGVLVDDKESWSIRGEDGVVREEPALVRNGPPRSLLNGRRMLWRLEEALGRMNPAEDKYASPLVEELDLFVTATDLEGRDTVLELDRGVVHEKRHAHRSHFRYAPRERRTDFADDDSSFMAYAARCTSSFPFAFEPMALNMLGATAEGWKKFYPDYAGVEPPFEERRFSDGGILDNKPFSYAIETIEHRQASVPVQRKLLFIEPDPSAVGRASGKVWNAIQTAQAAALGIRGVETIREDIERVLERNRDIARLRDITSQLHEDAEPTGRLTALALEQPDAEWAEQTLRQTVAADDGRWGPSYGSYHRLKVRGLVDHLGRIVARAAAGIDHRSDEALAVTYLVRAWKERSYEENGAGGRRTDNAFLIDFDVPYRVRRLTFVLQKLRDLTSRDRDVVTRAIAATPLAADSLGDPEQVMAVARTLRTELHAIRRGLQDVEAELAAPDGPLAGVTGALGLTKEHLAAILDAGDDAAKLAVAQELLADRREPFDRLVERVTPVFTDAARAAGRRVGEILGPHTSANVTPAQGGPNYTLPYLLRFYYDAFEAYDLVLHPHYARVGEGILVDVSRISPLDAELPHVDPDTNRTLRGIGLHHFAAFLDAAWRRNDIVWGRLNAAECLIRTLLPDHPDADRLIKRAQEIIVGEYEAKLTGRDPGWPWHRTVEKPEEVRTRKALVRAAEVIGPLVDAILVEGGHDRAVLEAVAAEHSSVAGRAAKAGWAAYAWRLVTRALDPRDTGWFSNLRAGLHVLRAALRPVTLAAVAALALIWVALLKTDVFSDDKLIGVAVGVGLVVLAAAIGVLAGVWALRRFAFRKVYKAVFDPKKEDAAVDSG